MPSSSCGCCKRGRAPRSIVKAPAVQETSRPHSIVLGPMTVHLSNPSQSPYTFAPATTATMLFGNLSCTMPNRSLSLPACMLTARRTWKPFT